MKTPALALHVFRKDFRRYWPLGLAAAALIVFKTLGPLWAINLSTGDYTRDDLLGSIIWWPIIFILVVAVMQEDRTVGDKAFWRTRPISPRAVLAAKLSFLALTVAVPALLANAWLVMALDAPANVSLGIGIETTGFMLLIAFAAALIASITSTLLQAGLAALGAVAVAEIFFAFRDPWAGIYFAMPWDPDVRYPGMRIALACLYAGIALVGLLAHQFFTRRTVRTVIMLLIAAPLILFVSGRWFPEFRHVTTTLAEQFPATPLTQTDSLSLSIETPAEVLSQTWVWDNGRHRREVESMVEASMNIRGVPAGRVFELLSVTSRLTFQDGQEVAFPRVSPVSLLALRVQQESAICRVLGLEFSEPAEQRTRTSSLFSASDERLAAIAGKRGRLSASFELGERAFREELRLPIRGGSRWKSNGERWQISSIEYPQDRWGGQSARLGVNYLRATSLLAPYGDARPDQVVDEMTASRISRGFVLLNRERGEYAMSPGLSQKNLGIVANTAYTLTFTGPKRNGSPVAGAKLDAAWMAGAELIILKSEMLGTTKKLVVIEDFLVPTKENKGVNIFR